MNASISGKELPVTKNGIPTAEELRMMAQTDIRKVDRNTLVDINSVEIDVSLSREDKFLSFLQQIKNPYCYLDRGIVVKLSFMDTDVTLEDRLRAYLHNI